MKINKITTGFVIQTYDTELKQWTGQEFVAGDQTEYEVADIGEIIDPDDARPESSKPYLPFQMQQPDEIAHD